MLEQDDLLRLHAATISAGLASSSGRSALLANLPPDFVAGLTQAGSPSEQILCDLNALNTAEVLKNGSEPMQVWLANALALTGSRAAGAVFGAALASLRSSLPSVREDPDPGARPPEELEFRIVATSTSEVDPDLPSHLSGIPSGPKVPDYLVTRALIDAYSENFGRRPVAEQLLREATRMRLQLDANATYIKAGHLPDIIAGADAYWHEVFHEACRHGPRMVAAILLTADYSTFSQEARRDRANLLRFLLKKK
jgi:hypothetical protein